MIVSGLLGLPGKLRIVLWTVYYLLGIVLGKDLPPSSSTPSQPLGLTERSFHGRVIRTPRTVINPGDGWRLQRAVEAARAREKQRLEKKSS